MPSYSEVEYWDERYRRDVSPADARVQGKAGKKVATIPNAFDWQVHFSLGALLY